MRLFDKKSTLAGFMIGFAALLSLHIDNKILSSLFFSIGLLYIRISNLLLYTGQIQYIRDGTRSMKDLVIILFNNLCGVILIIPLLLLLDKSEITVKYYTNFTAKWTQPWYYYLFSGFCCGTLMTIATKKQSPLWLSSMCVMAFILAGFNHSIADWFYIDFKYFYLWCLVVIGNFIGGYIVAEKKINKSSMNKRKIIFLDIDDVLNSNSSLN